MLCSQPKVAVEGSPPPFVHHLEPPARAPHAKLLWLQAIINYNTTPALRDMACRLVGRQVLQLRGKPAGGGVARRPQRAENAAAVTERRQPREHLRKHSDGCRLKGFQPTGWRLTACPATGSDRRKCLRTLAFTSVRRPGSSWPAS